MVDKDTNITAEAHQNPCQGLFISQLLLVLKPPCLISAELLAPEVMNESIKIILKVFILIFIEYYSLYPRMCGLSQKINCYLQDHHPSQHWSFFQPNESALTFLRIVLSQEAAEHSCKYILPKNCLPILQTYMGTSEPLILPH